MITPIVNIARGRRTVLVSGRRLMLPDNYDIGAPFDADSAILPDRGAPDRTRRMLWRIGAMNERRSNAAGSLLRHLIPRRAFFWLFSGLAITNVGLAASAARNPAMFTITPPGAGALAGHYACLALLLVWHELGHCAAARRFDIRVDGIGVGVYLIFPALFSRISMVALLTRRERIILFLSGIYFQLIAGVVIGCAAVAWPSEGLRFALAANILTILFNLLPAFHLDGYRILVELLGAMKGRWTGLALAIASTVITAAVLAFLGFSLGRGLWSVARELIVAPSWQGGVSAGLMSLFLLMLLVATPTLLKNARG